MTTKQRRSLIPKHLMNVRLLPGSVRQWERNGKLESAALGRRIFHASARELRALGVDFKEAVL